VKDNEVDLFMYGNEHICWSLYFRGYCHWPWS